MGSAGYNFSGNYMLLADRQSRHHMQESQGQVGRLLTTGHSLIPYSVQMQFPWIARGCRSSGQIRMVVGTGHGELLPRPPGFYPNQTASDNGGWETITQINPNTSAPALCPIDCDTTLPNAGPPTQ